ncbi:MAG: TetR family transcriptional regulator [Mucilaginibacter sp.]|nr:TetR family transcriptional regulator [Mucilaginibacter sp.]
MSSHLNPSGNKEVAKRKLINAGGDILQTEGYHSLGVNRLDKQAGVNKKLIYRYFGNFNKVLETYVSETDFWLLFAEKFKIMKVPKGHAEMKQFFAELLKEQFNHFRQDEKLQQLILWELSSESG